MLIFPRPEKIDLIKKELFKQDEDPVKDYYNEIQDIIDRDPDACLPL